MKRLCIFYRLAGQWRDKPVEWIVCKRCQRELRQPGHMLGMLSTARRQLIEHVAQTWSGRVV